MNFNKRLLPNCHREFLILSHFAADEWDGMGRGWHVRRVWSRRDPDVSTTYPAQPIVPSLLAGDS